MVDISDKAITKRTAVASACVKLPEVVRNEFANGEIQTKKGSVIDTAIIAGTMAAKKTHDLIPLCHPLPLSQIILDVFPLDSNKGLEIVATVKTEWKTGVEMEALTAANIAALTIYDMCKAIDKNMTINNLRLTYKSGGKTNKQNLTNDPVK